MAKAAIKFKDCVAQAEQIMGCIKRREFAPIYLLMGEESYFIDMICNALSESILSPSEQAFNQITVYGKDTSAAQVVNLCRQMPMMGSYEVIILKEAQQIDSIDKLSLYTSKPQNSTILIICHKQKNVDKRSALYKQCLASGVVLESVRPRDYEIEPWLVNFLRGKGLEISQKALRMLTDHLGCDIEKISNEIEKLLVAMPQGTKSITEDHIEQNVGISKDFNSFELCNAVAIKDVAKAMDIAQHLSANPKENPLLLIVINLFALFRDLFIINYLRWQERRKGVSFPSDMELMKILKKSNPYVVAELKRKATLWTSPQLFKILGLMREYDAKSKGIDSGSASEGELLRELLMKIFTQQ